MKTIDTVMSKSAKMNISLFQRKHISGGVILSISRKYNYALVRLDALISTEATQNSLRDNYLRAA